MPEFLRDEDREVKQIHHAWSAPILVKDLILMMKRPAGDVGSRGKDNLDSNTGLYVFTSNSSTPWPGNSSNMGNCLYLGKADGQNGLRGRLKDYADTFFKILNGIPLGDAPKINGNLVAHFVRDKEQTWVRWVYLRNAGIYEGIMIDVYQPSYNKRQERDWSALSEDGDLRYGSGFRG